VQLLLLDAQVSRDFSLAVMDRGSKSSAAGTCVRNVCRGKIKPASACGGYCAAHGLSPDSCNCGVCGSYGGCGPHYSCSRTRSTFYGKALHACPATRSR